MTHRSKVTVDTTGIEIFGSGYYKDDKTIAQDGARATDLASYTILARQISDGYLVPLTEVDPAITPASLACGAIGGTLAAFAALASSSFKIGIDGETPFEVVCDFSGIDAVDDTHGFFLGGANGGAIGAYTALTDAAFSYVIDGVAGDTGAMDFTVCTTFDEVVEVINFTLNGIATMTYDYKLDKFKLISDSTGETSTVAAPGAPAAGTDISAAGFLNAAAGAATAGTGGEGLGESIVDIINAELAGRAECSFDGDKFIFWSPTQGYGSAVSYLTAGTTGTDISGAGYLNGLTGTGVLTAATTGDGTHLPWGIFWGDDIPFASIVAADVTNQMVLRGASDGVFVLDEDKVVLENSLTLDTYIPTAQKTIREYLEENLKIATRDVTVNGQVAPL